MVRYLITVPAAAAGNGSVSGVSWWEDVNESPLWQDRIFHCLAVLYGLVAVVALMLQLLILLNLKSAMRPTIPFSSISKDAVESSGIRLDYTKSVSLTQFPGQRVRSVVFVFRRTIQYFHPEIIQHVLLDVPSLAFFSTYALLVLFWAEIYYQARVVSTDGLRRNFFFINLAVYVVQVILWLIMWWKPVTLMVVISKMFFAGVSLFAALGFLLYGGRLFLMLHRFPVESKGRRKKLQEVGYVTSICFTCFLVRCIMMCFNAFDKAADLDVLDHPILNFSYYLLAEILPSSLVLFILRKLPSNSKRGSTQYHPIG